MADGDNSNGNGNNINGSIVARLGAKASRYRIQNKSLQDEIEELKKSNQKLTNQVSDLEARTDTKKLQETVTQLKGQLRERDHLDIFRKTAKELGAKENAIEDLWQLSGYKPETDNADPDQITELITEQKQKRAYLFGDSEVKKAEPKPAVGSGKGGTSSTGIPVVDSERAAIDPVYAMKNNERIVENARANVALRQ